jgi:hypothetical protein
MSGIQEMPCVSLVNYDLSDTGKYVLAKVKVRGENDKFVLFSNTEYISHGRNFDALQDLIDELGLQEGDEIKCLGGGRLTYSETEKTIRIWGASIEFGPADQETVLALLKQAFPDFTVVVD